MKIPNPWNAGKALKSIAQQISRGKPLTVSQETVDIRLRTCHECDFFDPNFGQCKVCSCIVSLKAQLATEKCPKGRWPFTNS